jgi:hypothetical protein
MEQMKRQAIVLSLTVLAAATLLLAHPPQAFAKTIQDAHCDQGTGSNFLGYKKYSESFTAGHSGKLTNGFVESWNKLNQLATYTVEIWDADAFGIPTGTSGSFG